MMPTDEEVVRHLCPTAYFSGADWMGYSVYTTSGTKAQHLGSGATPDIAWKNARRRLESGEVVINGPGESGKKGVV